MMAKFSGETVLRLSQKMGGMLGFVGAMREFGYPTPDVSNLDDRNGSIGSALFTYGCTAKRPERGGPYSEHHMLWRPHTQYACLPGTRARVRTALLCWKTVCPRLPRDMRNMLLLVLRQ